MCLDLWQRTGNKDPSWWDAKEAQISATGGKAVSATPLISVPFDMPLNKVAEVARKWERPQTKHRSPRALAEYVSLQTAVVMLIHSSNARSAANSCLSRLESYRLEQQAMGPRTLPNKRYSFQCSIWILSDAAIIYRIVLRHV